MSLLLSKGTSLRSRLGFTLIELLVVITVVAIIAAVILPAIFRARARARQIACLSNLRQLGLGILQYSTDYDERCPLYFSGVHVTPGNRNPGYGGPSQPPYLYWTELISPYVQRQPSHDFNSASKIFVCPDAPFDNAAVAGHGLSNVSSYGLTDNWAEWYCPDDCNNGVGQSHSFTEAVAPSTTVLLAETLNDPDALFPGSSLAMSPIDGGNSGYFYAACSDPPFSQARMFDNLSWRHVSPKRRWCEKPPPGARINVAYSDGHVRSEGLATLSQFDRWSIKQGGGDVGCQTLPNGERPCWYP